jgi:hypothetical protein
LRLGAGTGRGAGASTEALAGGAAFTPISFTTFVIPATPAASRAASERCASFETVPLSVATPPETATCTG